MRVLIFSLPLRKLLLLIVSIGYSVNMASCNLKERKFLTHVLSILKLISDNFRSRTFHSQCENLKQISRIQFLFSFSFSFCSGLLSPQNLSTVKAFNYSFSEMHKRLVFALGYRRKEVNHRIAECHIL